MTVQSVLASLWFRRAGLFFVYCLACFWVLDAFAGPVKPVLPAPLGSLLIVGGGDTPMAVQRRFVELAGGANVARIAIFPMASTESDEEVEEVIADFTKLGAQTAIVPATGEAVNSAWLEGFTGYWFIGGDQSRLADTLRGTSMLDVLQQRYMDGAVIGGTSAGASVMSSLMITGRLKTPSDAEEADTLNIARGVMDLSMGLGFIKGAIIDQHFMRRARYNRLISAVLDHPVMLGVGIDEETALLVRPDGNWEVLGNNYVKIFDAYRALIIDDDGPMAKASDIRMHVLPAGGVFNTRSRKVSFPGS